MCSSLGDCHLKFCTLVPKLGFALAFSFALAVAANAQVTNVTGETQRPMPGTGRDYIHMLNETIDPATGGLSIRIAIPAPPGRNITMPFSIGYDSNSAWHMEPLTPSSKPIPHYEFSLVSLGGWSYTIPVLTSQQILWYPLNGNSGNSPGCSATTSYIFADSSGGRHTFGLGHIDNYNTTVQQQEESCSGSNFTEAQTGADGQYQAMLSGAVTSNENPAINQDGTPIIVDADGTVYNFGNDWGCTANGTPFRSGVPSFIEDRNGNTLGLSASGNSQCGDASLSVSDAFGQVISGSNFAQNGSTLTVSGFTNPYTFTWASSSPTGLAISHKQMQTDSNCAGLPSTAGNLAPSVVTAIELPNLKSYTFGYDSATGFINQIIYPTGGYVSYTWGVNTLAGVTSFTDALGGVNACVFEYDEPVIAKRIVSFDGTTQALEQDFTYTTTWSTSAPWQWTSKTTTVITKDLIRNTSFATVYTYGFAYATQQPDTGVPNDGSQLPVEVTEQFYPYSTPSGPTLKTVTKNLGGAPPQLNCEVDTLDNGQSGGTFYSYGPGTQITDKKEFDYGSVSASNCTTDSPPSAPLRETTISYQGFSPIPMYPTAASIFDRPSSVKVYKNGTTGTLMSETDYSYDQATTTSVSPVANAHDETCYAPSPTAQCPITTTIPRGNATTTTKQCFPSCSNVITTYAYDETGQITSIKDPCGNGACADVYGTNHTTNFYYTDSYTILSGSQNTSYTPSFNTHAYVSEIQDPLGHQDYFTYDFHNSQLTVHKDQNGQYTYYLYNDPFDRPTLFTYADTGQTTFSYNDSAPTPSVTTTKKVNGSGGAITSVSVMDGIGHITQSKVTYGSGSTAIVSTAYDGLGRKYTATNPYFTTSDPTYGVTTYSYDPLSRLVKVQNPDNTSSTTSYTGRATQVNDAGNGVKSIQRVSQADYLGRLSSVCEISGTTLTDGTGGAPSSCGQDITTANGFPTSYTYDVLGNLLSVTQGTLASRGFAYDSLSRLTQSTNPEANTAPTGGTVVPTTYAYDLNGNLANKTEPAQNQTGTSTVTLTYCYDPLNRMTAKGYSLQTCSSTGSLPTPAASFVFDTCPSGGCPTGYPSTPNTTGRLVEGYTSNSRTFSSYDPMGRTSNEWQCTPLNCGSAYYNLGPYVYDLVGDMTSAVNGLGVTFSYSYPSGQLTQLTSSLSDSNHPGTLLTTVTYNALDAPVSGSLGNGMNEAWGYSNRTWPQSLSVSGPNSTAASSTAGAVITGTEQSYPTSPTGSTATIDIASSCTSSCGSGTVIITINGVRGSASWSGSLGNEASAIASAASSTGLVSAYSQNVTSGVWKAVLTSYATGSSSNYSLTCSAPYISQCPGSMSGGTNGTTVYDTGTVSITVNGFLASTSYGSTSTPSSLASSLASTLNGSSSPVTAIVSSNVLTITSKATGSAANYSYSVSSTSNNPSSFSPPSFLITGSGTTLIGGAGGYSFVTAFAPDGDILAANDSVNGNWVYGYDDFNRVLAATELSPSNAYTYDYDRYGNRWHQYLGGVCTAGTSFCLTFDTNNRVNNGAQSYDTAGNVIQDSQHHYYYDAENHLIQVDGTPGTCSTATACYTYDANGQRVEKTVSGGNLYYLYDLAGHPFVEINSSGSWDRTEVYIGSHHLNTYVGGTSGVTYFDHGDWLGTERARTSVSGTNCEGISSLPFGDGEVTSGSCGDPSPLHFTGKERDSESGLDNFGARYNSSAIGRFMSPDPSSKRLIAQQDPQDWDLYAYTRNDPLALIDRNGKETELITLGARIGGRSAGSGGGSNPFGHSAIRIKNSKGDFVYSFDGNAKGKLILEKIPTALYLHDNEHGFQDSDVLGFAPNRSIKGDILKWSTDGKEEEATQTYLENFLKNQRKGKDQGDYDTVWNNCATNAAKALNAGGLDVWSWLSLSPGDLEMSVADSGTVAKYQNTLQVQKSFAQPPSQIQEEAERQCNLGNPAACEQ